MKKMMVQIWNKLVDAKGRNRCRFRSGTVYEVSASGSITRIHPPRPWRGKAERRQHLKLRRQRREQEAL